jgi:hypothetical protein
MLPDQRDQLGDFFVGFRLEGLGALLQRADCAWMADSDLVRGIQNP